MKCRYCGKEIISLREDFMCNKCREEFREITLSLGFKEEKNE